MPVSGRNKWFILVVAMLLFFLACRIGPEETSLPEPPGGYIAPNQEAYDRAEQNFYQSLQEAGGNHEARFRMTNEEVTTVVATALQKRADIPITDPQVWFTAGKIYMTGMVEGVGPAALPALIVGIPRINGQGQLEVEIDEAKVGSIDFPEAMIENITTTLNESLVDLQLDVQITGIEVLEGELIVAGKRIAP
jgi:hypothetical protein